MINKFLSVLLILILILGCQDEESMQDKPEATIESNELTAVPVEAMELKEKIIVQTLPLIGILIPNNSVDIYAEVSGKIIKVNSELGDYVKKNQTLAIIDDLIPESQFKQAQAHLLSAEANLDIAELNFKSDEILFENGDISELEFNNSKLSYNNAEAQYLSAKAQLSASEKKYNDTRIKTPISGFISRKNTDLGNMVSIGTIVYRVVDLSKLKINVSIPQEMINRVRINNQASVKITALNGKEFKGVIKRISPQADESSGGFDAELLVDNKDYIIKAGMIAKINLKLSKDQKVLAIPEYAVVLKNGDNYVYKIIDGFAELTIVKLGESVGENIIVLDGLSIYNKIVVVGMKNLGVKTKVNIEKIY